MFNFPLSLGKIKKPVTRIGKENLIKFEKFVWRFIMVQGRRNWYADHGHCRGFPLDVGRRLTVLRTVSPPLTLCIFQQQQQQQQRERTPTRWCPYLVLYVTVMLAAIAITRVWYAPCFCGCFLEDASLFLKIIELIIDVNIKLHYKVIYMYRTFTVWIYGAFLYLALFS